MSATRVKRSLDEWRGVVEQWQTSGLSAQSFAKREGLAHSSFAKWRKKVHEAPLASTSAKAPRFVEVRSPSFNPQQRESTSITVKLRNDVRVTLRGSVSIEQIRAIMEVFRP